MILYLLLSIYVFIIKDREFIKEGGFDMGRKKPSVPTTDLNWHTIFTITSAKRKQELVEDATELADLLFTHPNIIHITPSNGVIRLELPGRVSPPNGKKRHNGNYNRDSTTYLTDLFDYLKGRSYRSEMINSPLHIDSSLNISSSVPGSDKYTTPQHQLSY